MKNDNDNYWLKKEIEDTRQSLKNFVTLDRFTPVEKIVYGLVTLILAGFIAALIALVWKK